MHNSDGRIEIEEEVFNEITAGAGDSKSTHLTKESVVSGYNV